jgi:hypothetical protein
VNGIIHRLVEARAEGEEVRAARLQELQEMAARLLATARELPPGQDRHNAFREIGRFGAQIATLKGADLRVSTTRAEGEGE